MTRNSESWLWWLPEQPRKKVCFLWTVIKLQGGVGGETQGCWLKNSDSSRDKSEGQATQTKEMKNATPTSINN